MIRVKAKITLFRMGRKTPFVSGYRPLFNFIPEMKTSGQIVLHDRQELFPGDQALVEIIFLNKEYLGDSFGPGAHFTFGEGFEPIGEGVIKELI